MDTNPSQPSVFTPVVAEMHKEDQQGTTRPASLGVSGEERADPHINSGMSASIHIDPVYSASFIIYSESPSRCDASADSTAEVDLRKLELEKNKAEAEVALVSTQPSFPYVEQLTELLAKIKTLDALPSLLNKVTEALNKFAQLAKGEKNTNQVTISQLFQRKVAKDAKRANLKSQSKLTTAPITTAITPPTTSHFNLLFSNVHQRAPLKLRGSQQRKTRERKPLADQKFADSHNMVVALEKPAESDGFEQIVDFLNAHTIKKKVIITESTIKRDLQLEDAEGMDCLPTATNFEELTRIGYEKLSQKLTFYKAFFSPQWNYLIHTILQCLSAKTTAWNEFSSTMASANNLLSHKPKV
ncbi:hypothetical protein Tco_0007737 [Tanacetum coccineum]